jgi:hypothetical protein
MQCAHGPVAGVERTLIVGSKSDGKVESAPGTSTPGRRAAATFTA